MKVEPNDMSSEPPRKRSRVVPPPLEGLSDDGFFQDSDSEPEFAEPKPRVNDFTMDELMEPTAMPPNPKRTQKTKAKPFSFFNFLKKTKK